MGEGILTQLPADFSKSCKVVIGPESITTPNIGSIAMREIEEGMRKG